jgi:hypothetical protein
MPDLSSKLIGPQKVNVGGRITCKTETETKQVAFSPLPSALVAVSRKEKPRWQAVEEIV